MIVNVDNMLFFFFARGSGLIWRRADVRGCGWAVSGRDGWGGGRRLSELITSGTEIVVHDGAWRAGVV